MAALAANGTLTLNLTQGNDDVVVQQVSAVNSGVIVSVTLGGKTIHRAGIESRTPLSGNDAQRVNTGDGSSFFNSCTLANPTVALTLAAGLDARPRPGAAGAAGAAVADRRRVGDGCDS